METTDCPATKKRRLALNNSIGLQGINFLSLPEEHSGLGVNRLSCKFGLNKKHASDIDGWVSFAIASKVLRLNSVTLDPSHEVCGFSNITTLDLDNTLILQDLQYLLLKCPALEWLRIRLCPRLYNLNVAEPLPKLKFLSVQDCAIKKIDLHAHNLTSFQYRGDEVSFFALKECLNLKKASIVFLMEHNLEYIFTGLPNALPHVETLHVEVLAMTQIHRFFQPPLKFKYLRHLRMEINFGNGGHRSDKNAVLQLAYLLDAAPLLVDLHLDMVCMSSTSRPSPVGIMDHSHHNLKRNCITGFCGNGGQVALVEYILLNALPLERMVIDLKTKKSQMVDLCGVRTARELVRKDRKGVLMVVEHPQSFMAGTFWETTSVINKWSSYVISEGVGIQTQLRFSVFVS